MKFLLILDSVEFPSAPTPMLARRVAAALLTQGHNVHLLELYDGETLPPEAPGCRRFLVPFADERKMNEILEFGKAGGTPVPVRLAKLFLHPQAAAAAARQLLLKKSRRRVRAQREIEQLDRQFHYDAAVAVAAPYAGSFALAAARFGGKKASWQMDPYAANQDYAAPGSWQTERQLDRAMHRVFVAPTAAADFAPGAPLQQLADKMRVLDFPSLVPPPNFSAQPGARIRCVFVGSLYQTLRTPHFALALFSAMNEPDIELVFVGGGWNQFPADLLTPYKQTLGDRLIVTGPMPRCVAEEELARADVLLNLGNGVSNQVPSKLFEYFASGKPVLHLGKLADDPCLPYLKKWPLACLVLEQEGATPEVAARVNEFLHTQGRARLRFETAQTLYWQNTPQAAAALLQKELEEAAL